MSSISRWRNGLMALSVIGGSCSWVRFCAPQSQDRMPASRYSTSCHQLPRERFSPSTLCGLMVARWGRLLCADSGPSALATEREGSTLFGPSNLTQSSKRVDEEVPLRDNKT